MKRALVSVSDKTNLVPFVSSLVELGYEIISTGGTKKALEAAGIKTIGISEVTEFSGNHGWACKNTASKGSRGIALCEG